jgi:hypothetical protein
MRTIGLIVIVVGAVAAVFAAGYQTAVLEVAVGVRAVGTLISAGLPVIPFLFIVGALILALAPEEEE